MKSSEPVQPSGNTPEPRIEKWMREAVDEWFGDRTGPAVPDIAAALVEVIAKHYPGRVAASSQSKTLALSTPERELQTIIASHSASQHDYRLSEREVDILHDLLTRLVAASSKEAPPGHDNTERCKAVFLRCFHKYPVDMGPVSDVLIAPIVDAMEVWANERLIYAQDQLRRANEEIATLRKDCIALRGAEATPSPATKCPHGKTADHCTCSCHDEKERCEECCDGAGARSVVVAPQTFHAALLKYGRHETYCNRIVNGVSECNCGYAEALAGVAALQKEILKYYRPPFEFREPQSEIGGPCIYDRDGNQIAMLFWPTHPVEETEAAEQETYALGRAMALAALPSEEETKGPRCESVYTDDGSTFRCAKQLGHGALHGQGNWEWWDEPEIRELPAPPVPKITKEKES